MNQSGALCDLCGGELSQGTTSLQLWRGEELIILRNIPAEVCQQCGQSQLSAEISEKIDRFLEEYQQYLPKRYISVPEFSAEQILGD